jgi:hypothetical protein
MNALALKRRFYAAGAHLAISTLVLLAPLILIFYYWFPPPYFDSDGGLQAMLILTLVHFIVGPVLTFVIFSPDKLVWKIKFDFIVIGALQIAALSLGGYIVYDQRPVAVVLAKDKFIPVSANTIRQQGASVADLRAFSRQSPALVFSRPPADREQFAQMMLLALNEGIDIVAQINTFEPLSDHLSEAAGNQPDLRELESENVDFADELKAFLKARNARREDFFYIPFSGRYKNVLLVIDERGRLAGALRNAYNL